MEFLIELILELLLEGGQEICANRKISTWIRYPIAFILILFFAVIILGLLFIGIYIIKDNLIVSLFFIIVSIVLLIGAIIKFKKVYVEIERK